MTDCWYDDDDDDDIYKHVRLKTTDYFLFEIFKWWGSSLQDIFFFSALRWWR